MGYKLLVAEDEAVIRKGLLMAVDWAANGFDAPFEAGDGRQALQGIEEHRPDVVLMDINLPIINGLDVLEQSMDRYGYAAIVVTGFSEFEYAQRAMRYGVTDFLLKPLDLDELQEALENAKLERQRRQAYELYQRSQQDLRAVDLLAGMQQQPDPAIDKMIELLHQNLSDKITLRDIAEQLNYSETHLIRKFKAATGTNYSDYLSRLRIQQAMALLKEGTTDLQAVADACGFSEYKYFSLVFRKYMGCSPREYIKMVK